MDEHHYAAPDFQLGAEASQENVPPQSRTTPIREYTVTCNNPHPVVTTLRNVADMLEHGQLEHVSGGILVTQQTGSLGRQMVLIDSNLTLQEVL